MAVLFEWISPGGGSFSKKENWRQFPGTPVVGVPKAGDATDFSIGGSYSVNVNGATVGSIGTSDNLKLTGGATATRGITGVSTGGETKTLTLADGTYRTDPSQGGTIGGTKLVIENATVFGGGVSGVSGLTTLNSTFNLSGQFNDYFIGNGAISVTGGSITSKFVSFAGTGTILNATIRTPDADGPAQLGRFLLSGNNQLNGVKAHVHTADFQGDVSWTGGELTVLVFTSGKSSDPTDVISFRGADIVSGSVGKSVGSSDPSAIALSDAHWRNAYAFNTSGELTMNAGASLKTHVFNAEPGLGSGAEVTLTGRSTHLDVATKLTALTLSVRAGADVDVGRGATLVAAGSEVTGRGTTLDVGGMLTLDGAIDIARKAVVTSGSAALNFAAIDLTAGSSWTIKTALRSTTEFDSISVVAATFKAAATSLNGGAFDVTGGGTASLGVLTATGDATISASQASTLTIKSASGEGTVSLESGSTLRLTGIDKDVDVHFKDDATLSLARANLFQATLHDFAAGDAIKIDGLSARATIRAVDRGDTTDVLFLVKGKEVGSLNFDGDHAARDFRFNAASGTLTSSDPIRGDAAKNTLVGTVGDDRMDGLGGNDRIESLFGNDLLTGGGGRDRFVFDSAVRSTSVDVIKDFVHGQDTLELDRSIFTALKAGRPVDFVYEGHTAHDASRRLSYDDQTGVLSYDLNGARPGKTVEIAVLQTDPHLTATDFHIV